MHKNIHTERTAIADVRSMIDCSIPQRKTHSKLYLSYIRQHEVLKRKIASDKSKMKENHQPAHSKHQSNLMPVTSQPSQVHPRELVHFFHQ